uniref:WWE domain-containing protein n=1 Tax=Macrostomum lignano TaxID=282301 RepID=A0A1I8IIZ8_9PLAT
PQAQSAAVSTASPAAAAAAASGYKRGDLATVAESSAVAAAAAEAAVLSQDWRESKTADGRIYYWNTKTRGEGREAVAWIELNLLYSSVIKLICDSFSTETVWERPQPKPAASASDAKPAVKSTKIRVLGNSGPTAAAAASVTPAAAPAAIEAASAPVVGPWTPVTSSSSTSCSAVSSQQKPVSSAQQPQIPIKRPAIVEKVLPAGSLKRSTDTDDTCTFKSKRPK